MSPSRKLRLYQRRLEALKQRETFLSTRLAADYTNSDKRQRMEAELAALRWAVELADRYVQNYSIRFLRSDGQQVA